MRPTVIYIACTALGMTLATSSFAAEVYRWVDENGKVHFSDKKPVDDGAETVDIKAPPVLPPDEGELRRRELLRRAEEDFAYKQRRAAEDQAAAALEEETTAARSAQQSKCNNARIRLGVLAANMPIYWTTSGEMRPAWSNDMYRGARRYIADNERPALRTVAERDIQTHCHDPDNTDAQYLTYRRWEHQQWCQALRADIDFTRQARARTPREDVEALQARYARECSQN